MFSPILPFPYFPPIQSKYSLRNAYIASSTTKVFTWRLPSTVFLTRYSSTLLTHQYKTESHPSRKQTPHLPDQRSSQQTHGFCPRDCPRSRWVRPLPHRIVPSFLSRQEPKKMSAGLTERASWIYRLAPYERRVIELLRNSKDKRARKLAKKRVCCFPLPYLTHRLSIPKTTVNVLNYYCGKTSLEI